VKKCLFVLCLIALCMLVGNASAQQKDPLPAPTPDMGVNETTQRQDQEPVLLARVSRLVLIGTEIRNFTGENVGIIEDLLVDTISGDVRYVVMSAERFAGHSQLLAVPADVFKLDRGNGVLLLDVSRYVLGSAPSFERGQWPDMADTSWVKLVHDFYGH
jgi:hypothetical protein